MNDSRILVGFDASVYVAGILKKHVKPTRNVCPLIIESARAGDFKVLALRSVLAEFRVICEKYDELDVFDNELQDFVQECTTVYEEWPTLEEIRARKAKLWALMKHEPDVVHAIAVGKARPDYFISSNDEHWKPSLGAHLGGCQVVTPHVFCVRRKIPMPFGS